MRKGILLTVTASARRRLKALLKNRNAPQKHVWRAQIVLLSAEGLGTNAIMRRTGKSKPCVWRWQERFMEEGVDGLLRDKTRKPGKAPLSPRVAERVVALTRGPPPGETTYWTGAMMAEASGISVSAVQDQIAEGTHAGTLSFDASVAEYDPVVGSLAVTVTDDDAVGFTISAMSAPTTEGGGTATFTVRLNSLPTANVVQLIEQP